MAYSTVESAINPNFDPFIDTETQLKFEAAYLRGSQGHPPADTCNDKLGQHLTDTEEFTTTDDGDNDKQAKHVPDTE